MTAQAPFSFFGTPWSFRLFFQPAETHRCQASDCCALAAARPHPQQAGHAQRRRASRRRLDQSRGGGRTPQAVLAGM